MFGGVKLLSGQNKTWQVLAHNTVVSQKRVPSEDHVLHEMYEDDPWYVAKRQQAVCTPRTVLDCPNKPSNLGHMFISCGSVESWVPWAKGFKFTVSHDGADGESPRLVQRHHLLQVVSDG
jgi:hypothetical protein